MTSWLKVSSELGDCSAWWLRRVSMMKVGMAPLRLGLMMQHCCKAIRPP
jgi:hypothetical protein